MMSKFILDLYVFLSNVFRWFNYYYVALVLIRLIFNAHKAFKETGTNIPKQMKEPFRAKFRYFKNTLVVNVFDKEEKMYKYLEKAVLWLIIRAALNMLVWAYIGYCYWKGVV